MNIVTTLAAVAVGTMLLTTAPVWANCGGDHGSQGRKDAARHHESYKGDHHDMAGKDGHHRGYRDGKDSARGVDKQSKRRAGEDRRWQRGQRGDRMSWRRYGHMRHMSYRQRPWAVLETSGEYDPAVFVGVWPARPTHGVWWERPAGAETREIRIYRRDAMERLDDLDEMEYMDGNDGLRRWEHR